MPRPERSLPAQQLGDVFSAFAAALGAADKVVELIQRAPQMPDPGRLQPSAFSGHLELRDVEFSYPSRPDTRVLSGVSLSVAPGEARRPQSFAGPCSLYWEDHGLLDDGVPGVRISMNELL